MSALPAHATSNADMPPPTCDEKTNDTTLLQVLNRPGLRDAVLAQPHMTPAGRQDEMQVQANLRLLARLRGGLSGGFTRAAAARLGIDVESLWRNLHGGSAIPLALLTCALGLDRAVFTRVLGDWQTIHGGPALPTAVKPLILSIFTLEPDEALRRLQAGLR